MWRKAVSWRNGARQLTALRHTGIPGGRAVQGRKRLVYWLLASVMIATNVAMAQEQDENDPARALALVGATIKARGGDAYLEMRATVARGQYTGYGKGGSGAAQSVADYMSP